MGYSVEFVDGWYQVIDRDKSVHSENGDTNGGHRLAATEQFINGSPDIVLCGIVEDILNIMQDGYSIIIGDADQNSEESDLFYRVEMRG